MPEHTTDPSRSPEDIRLRPVDMTPEEEDNRSDKSYYQQTLACFSAMLTMVAAGTVYGWSTTCLRSITSETGYVPLMMEKDEYSLITALVVFGSIIGSFVGAHLADRIGRKYCLVVSSAMFTAGWLIIYVANSVRVLYLAQMIHGIGVGIARTINPMYLSEIADIRIRGMLGSLITLAVYTGTAITATLEFFLTYELFLGILIIISIISFLSNMCFPETPYFLVAKGLHVRARKSLAYYKGILDTDEANTEIHALRAQTKYELYPQARYELYQQSRSDLPSQSRTNIRPQFRSNLPSQSRSNLPSQFRSNLPSQSRSNLSSQSRSNLSQQSIHERLSDPTQEVDTEPRTDLPSQSRSNLSSQSRSNLSQQSIHERLSDPTQEVDTEPRTDLPSQSRSNLSSQSRSNLSQQSRSNLSQQSIHERLSDPTQEVDTEPRTDLPSQSRSNLSQESIHERLSDPIQEVDTEPMPDSHLPSSSNVTSTSEIHSEVVRDVHQQSTGELREQASRDAPELALHSSGALYSQSRSELYRQFRSNFRRLPNVNLSTLQNVDSRASPDMDEIHMDGTKCTGFTKLLVILQPSNRKAMFLMLVLIMSQQCSKHFFTMQHPEKLYREAKIVNDSYSAMLLVQIINLIAISYTTFRVDSVGRRKLLLVSILGTTLTLGGLAYYLFVAEQKLGGHTFDIIILIVLVIYQAMFQIGLGTIPTILQCELFPTELIGFIGATIVHFDGTIGFIVSKLYEVITDNIGEYMVYYIFAAPNILTYSMVYVWMPETQGKTYKEIEALLVGSIAYISDEDDRNDESDIHSI